MRNILLAVVVIVAGAAPALAAPITVNSYTPAQEERAKAAIIKAGYRPDVLAAAQDGNLFFTATKDGEIYQATVTASGKLFLSTGLPASDAGKPAAG